jgi:hypothetical protein
MYVLHEHKYIIAEDYVTGKKATIASEEILDF